MKNFSRKRDSGNNRRERGEKSQMHSAVCSDCGKNCEVPFRPTGNKPVYCNSCFGKEGDTSLRRRDGDSRRREKESKKMFPAKCASCGIQCEVPFRPTGDKPVYCNSCFGKVNQQDRNYSNKPNIEKSEISKADIAMINDQLISINRKFEKLLLVLNPEEKISISTKKEDFPKKKSNGSKKEKSASVTKLKVKEKKPIKKKEIKKSVKKTTKMKK